MLNKTEVIGLVNDMYTQSCKKRRH